MISFYLRKFCLIGGLVASYLGCSQGEIIPLWQNTIPNSVPSTDTEEVLSKDIISIRKVQRPTLEAFFPPKRNATGKAVIICPGGGYGSLSYDWEGSNVAKWFNTKNIAAFVLKYRLPNSKSINTSHLAPLQDIQRAVRLVRQNSEKWGVHKDSIGVIGFSAGGHLAATLGNQYDRDVLKVKDSVDSLSAKPNFMMLIYPVISMQDGITHKGSKTNLLGKDPNEDLVALYSNELQVTANTPKTFIVHSSDDKAVPVENSLLMYKALKDANILVEMHIFPAGGHGYGLAAGKAHLETWPDRLSDWLKQL